MLDVLKNSLRAHPFVSFRIILNDGGDFAVVTRYQIAIGQTQLTYLYPNSNRNAVIHQCQIASINTSESLDRP